MTEGADFPGWHTGAAMLDQAHARSSATVDELVANMRECPFTDPAERWAAAVGLITSLDRRRESAVLLTAVAVDRLSQRDDPGVTP